MSFTREKKFHKKCAVCGTVFVVSQDRAKFCSRLCKGRGFEAIRKAKRALNVPPNVAAAEDHRGVRLLRQRFCC